MVVTHVVLHEFLFALIEELPFGKLGAGWV